MIKGQILMKDKDNAVFLTYFGGSYFGEIEIIYKTTRKASAQVEGICTLLQISGDNFLEILEDWP